MEFTVLLRREILSGSENDLQKNYNLQHNPNFQNLLDEIYNDQSISIIVPLDQVKLYFSTPVPKKITDLITPYEDLEGEKINWIELRVDDYPGFDGKRKSKRSRKRKSKRSKKRKIKRSIKRKSKSVKIFKK
jgi:hypothetical protein